MDSRRSPLFKLRQSFIIKRETDIAHIRAQKSAHITWPRPEGRRFGDGALAYVSEQFADVTFDDAQISDAAVGIQVKLQDHPAGPIARKFLAGEQPCTRNGF